MVSEDLREFMQQTINRIVLHLILFYLLSSPQKLFNTNLSTINLKLQTIKRK